MTYRPKPPTNPAKAAALYTPGFSRPFTPKLCVIKGCGHEAKWEFELHLFPPVANDPHRLFPWKVKVEEGFAVCDEHKATMNAKQFLTAEGKERIAALAIKAGKPAPAWGRSRLSWSPMGESFSA